MVVEKLFENVDIRTVFGEMPSEITGIEDRASEVKEGYAFFARKGSVSDGADYALEAVKNGAAQSPDNSIPAKNKARPMLQSQR